MIGISITDATQKSGLGRLSDSALGIAYLNFDPAALDVGNVVRRQVLPTFLADMFKEVAGAQISGSDELVAHCNALSSQVPALWVYLKLVDPTVQLPKGYAKPFTWDDLYAGEVYADFKLIARFWVSKLEALLKGLLTLFRTAVMLMTQLAIAAMETQQDAGASAAAVIGMTVRGDMLVNADEGSPTAQAILLEHAQWFASQVLQLDVKVAALAASHVAEYAALTAAQLELCQHLGWLASALTQMHDLSAWPWYEQLHLAASWVADVVGPFVKDTQLSLADYAPQFAQMAAFAGAVGVKHEVDFQQTLFDTIIGNRSLDRFNPTEDIPLLVSCLTQLFHDKDPLPEEVERLDELCRRVTGYDSLPLMYMFMVSQDNILQATYEAGDPALVRGRAELLDQMGKIKENIHFLEAMIAKNLDGSGFEWRSHEVQELNQLTEENHEALLKGDADAIALIEGYINRTDLSTHNPDSMRRLRSLMIERISDQKKLRILSAQEQVERVRQRATSDTLIADLSTELQDIYRQMADTEKEALAFLYSMKMDVTTDELRAALTWYVNGGATLHATHPEKFNFTITSKRVPVFSFIQNAEDVDVLCHRLDRIVLLEARLKEINQQIKGRYASLEGTRRRWFWGYVMIFGLMGFAFIWLLTWWVTKPAVVAQIPNPQSPLEPDTSPAPTPAQPIITAAEEEATEGWWQGWTRVWTAARYSNIPVLRSVMATLSQMAAAQGLQYFSWEHIEPSLLYQPIVLRTFTGAGYALAFWWAATSIGVGVIRIAWATANIRALHRVHAIDASPQLGIPGQLTIHRGSITASSVFIMQHATTAWWQFGAKLMADQVMMMNLGGGIISCLGLPRVANLARYVLRPNMANVPGMLMPNNPNALETTAVYFGLSSGNLRTLPSPTGGPTINVIDNGNGSAPLLMPQTRTPQVQMLEYRQQTRHRSPLQNDNNTYNADGGWGGASRPSKIEEVDE